MVNGVVGNHAFRNDFESFRTCLFYHVAAERAGKTV